MTLQGMNNNFKRYVNEASGISIKCKRELVKLVERDFYVDLPNEDFLNIDFELLENGNIVMRDVEYETSNKINNKEELNDRFKKFEEDVDYLLDKNATDFKTMRRNNEIGNLLIVILLTIVFIAIAYYTITRFFIGDLSGFIWIVILVVFYVIPAVSGNLIKRYKRAFDFIKKLFK